VITLLNRTSVLPSKPNFKSAEDARVTKDLRTNKYPKRLLRKCLAENLELKEGMNDQ